MRQMVHIYSSIQAYNSMDVTRMFRYVDNQVCKCDVIGCRYHYYGIAVKETSQYYDVMYSKKGAAWVNEAGKKEVTKQTVAYSPRSKLGTLLPEFPNVKDLHLPANLPEERVNTHLFFKALPQHWWEITKYCTNTLLLYLNGVFRYLFLVIKMAHL